MLARNILKSELAFQGITHSTLAEKLNQAGLSETKASIDSKLSRGTFSANFFLDCLIAINVQNIELTNITHKTGSK